MKKLTILGLIAGLLIGTVFTANAQDAAGEQAKKSALVLYAGPAFSMAAIDGGANPSCKISYLAGVAYERQFKSDFGFVAGLEYTEKGTDKFLYESGDEADFGLQYVQLNLALKYSKEFWGIQGFGQAGPYVGYGIGGKTEINGYKLDSFKDVSSDGEMIYADGGAGFKRFDAGIRVAVGVEFHHIRIMGGYQRGFIDISDKLMIANKYRNEGFFASIGYAFQF